MSEKTKIVILSYYMYPCHEPVLEYLFAKELGKKYDIVFLFNGGVALSRTLKWHSSEVLLGWNVRHAEKISITLKLWMNICKWYRLFNLLVSRKVKTIWVRDQPVTAFFITLLKTIFRFNVYFQYTAPLGEVLVAYFKDYKSIYNIRHILHGWIHNLFLANIIMKADIIFPITEYHKNELEKIAGKRKYIALTMGIDESWIQSERQKVPYLENIKKDYDIITYFGTMNFSRKPIFILKIFSEVKKKFRNCKLLLMGKTSYLWEENELKSACNQLGIDKDVIFSGQLSREAVRDHLAYCTVSISAIPPEKYYIISSPTKVYESLGNGVPVVAYNEIFEQKKILEESGGGVGLWADGGK